MVQGCYATVKIKKLQLECWLGRVDARIMTVWLWELELELDVDFGSFCEIACGNFTALPAWKPQRHSNGALQGIIARSLGAIASSKYESGLKCMLVSFILSIQIRNDLVQRLDIVPHLRTVVMP